MCNANMRRINVLSEHLPEQSNAYNSETEIAISRIFDIGRTGAVQYPGIPANAPYSGNSVVTMSGFGTLGRFGNQVLQYIFMKCFAEQHGISEIQLPGWVGASIFGLSDRPVQRAFPPAVEFRGTLANSTFTTELIDYVKSSNSNCAVPELRPGDLNGNSQNSLKNCDIWGWFQWHSSVFAPYRSLIQETFSPVEEIRRDMQSSFEKMVRFKGGIRRTVVGLHIRLGDYKNISASSFGYCAPTSWYLKWLERHWSTFENPVLFVASDDLNAVKSDFAKFHPITADDVGITVPEQYSYLKAGFFPDWFSLTQCDVLAISNSTFSFTACMMNQVPNSRFFRAHYLGDMVPFDPWNADPVIHRDLSKSAIATLWETLQIVYNTQGFRGLVRNVVIDIPLYAARALTMKILLR